MNRRVTIYSFGVVFNWPMSELEAKEAGKWVAKLDACGQFTTPLGAIMMPYCNEDVSPIFGTIYNGIERHEP